MDAEDDNEDLVVLLGTCGASSLSMSLVVRGLREIAFAADKVFEVDVEDDNADLVILLGICEASSLSMYFSCGRP